MSTQHGRNPVLTQASHVIEDVYLPRILACLAKLSTEQIWWRPHETFNSVGNLVLHLDGNVRQWVISGLGGAIDNRKRDQEFSQCNTIRGKALAGRLRKTVRQACSILGKLSDEDLEAVHSIQKFRVTGFQAAFHVAEHFSHHAGQIILITKLLTGSDLKFTRLPGGARSRLKALPAW